MSRAAPALAHHFLVECAAERVGPRPADRWVISLLLMRSIVGRRSSRPDGAYEALLWRSCMTTHCSSRRTAGGSGRDRGIKSESCQRLSNARPVCSRPSPGSLVVMNSSSRGSRCSSWPGRWLLHCGRRRRCRCADTPPQGVADGLLSPSGGPGRRRNDDGHLDAVVQSDVRVFGHVVNSLFRLDENHALMS